MPLGLLPSSTAYVILTAPAAREVAAWQTKASMLVEMGTAVGLFIATFTNRFFAR